MFRRVLSAAIIGLDVYPVQVEVDVSDGLPGFVLVGYVSMQVREAQDRVRTALRNAGFSLPPKRITVNLAPADIRKDSTGFDLPIAAAILSAIGIVLEESLEGVFMIGELGLNGEVHPVSGILPMVSNAKSCGCHKCIVPEENLAEARVIQGVQSIGVKNIRELLDYLCHDYSREEKERDQFSISTRYEVDFEDICGQESAKRAALIAVSGFHNLLFIGPPGTGKTMLARRIPTILPPLSRQESLEISQIYSIAGLLPKDQPLMGTRPFCAPHHTATPKALSGGGLIPKPGLVTLSHRGCLFLDELPEFSGKSLEILRQPLEERKISISRTGGTCCFPAEFILLAAMNPCPCGYYPDMNRCVCTTTDIKRYQKKISYPLLDRIDMCTEVSEIPYEELQKNEKGKITSVQLREKVERAQKKQKERYREAGFLFNSELPAARLKEFCPLTKKGEQLLEKTYRKLQLSARGYHRILRIARTIADLDESEIIDVPHISEAVYYRGMDKKYWAGLE